MTVARSDPERPLLCNYAQKGPSLSDIVTAVAELENKINSQAK
jgi:hypothetical protein